MRANTRNLAITACALLALAAPSLAQVPTDPYVNSTGSWEQQHPDSWWMERVGLGSGPDSAWRQMPPDPSPVIVAVIDSGIDWNHLDIA